MPARPPRGPSALTDGVRSGAGRAPGTLKAPAGPTAKPGAHQGIAGRTGIRRLPKPPSNLEKRRAIAAAQCGQRPGP
jgi:hypothetical protein